MSVGTPLGRAVERSRARGGNNQWMVTFVDLVSLLLAFFVLLFSMASPDRAQFEKVETALRTALSAKPKVIKPQPPEIEAVTSVNAGRGLDLGYLERLLEQTLSRDPVLQASVVRRDGDRLRVSIPGDLIFASGDWSVLPAGREAVAALSIGLSSLRNKIIVEGHADPRPVSGQGRFSSNRELSLARAAAVSEILVASGYGEPITIHGAGSSRFGDLGPGLTQAQRFQLARRVDIVILQERGS